MSTITPSNYDKYWYIYAGSSASSANYRYFIGLKQIYTAGSTEITYQYIMATQGRNGYWYKGHNVTRKLELQLSGYTSQTFVNKTEKVTFASQNLTSSWKSDDWNIFEEGSITLNRIVQNDSYTPLLYYSVEVASASYTPPKVSGTETSIVVPARMSACGTPTISSPAANTKVSRTMGFTLSWSAATAGTNNPVAGYKVQVSANGSTWQDAGTTGASTLNKIIAPVNYGFSNGSTFYCQVKAIETTEMGASWSSSRSFQVNTPPVGPPTISPNDGTTSVNPKVLAHDSSGYKVTATPAVSGNTIRWKKVNDVVSTSNTYTINPSVNTEGNWTVYEWDGIDYSTNYVNVYVRKQSAPAAPILTVSLSGYKCNSASATIDPNRTASSHRWRLSYSGSNSNSFFSTSATLSNVNLLTALNNAVTATGALSFTIDYQYYDGVEWSAWASYSGSMGGSIGSVTVYNQYNNSNITDDDLGTAAYTIIYDKARLSYKINNANDEFFRVRSLTTTSTGPSFSLSSNNSGYTDFSVSGMEDGKTYEIIATLQPYVNNQWCFWTKTQKFTVQQCSTPFNDNSLIVPTANFHPNSWGSSTFEVSFGIIRTIAYTNTARLRYFISPTSSYSNTSKNLTTTRRINGDTIIGTITCSDLYNISTDSWCDENANNQIGYIIIQYTNALGKVYYKNAQVKFDFLTAPKISNISYTINESTSPSGSGSYLQYNKIISLTLPITTYNTTKHNIEVTLTPNSADSNVGATASKFTYSFTPTTTGALASSYVKTGTISYLYSNNYTVSAKVTNTGMTGTNSSAATLNSCAALKQYPGQVTLISIQENNATYSINKIGINDNTVTSDTVIAKLQYQEVGSSSWLNAALLSGTDFTNASSFTNASMPSAWTQVYGRIHISTVTSQSGLNSSTLNYITTPQLYYNITPTVKVRKNYLGINATSLTSNDLITIQALNSECKTIKFIDGLNVSTIQLGTSATMSNFIIDGGSW